MQVHSADIVGAPGRRHISLLRSLVADSGSASVVPVHTIVEVYRVADLGLECVLPSAEDEVNAACFHPLEVCTLLCRDPGQLALASLWPS